MDVLGFAIWGLLGAFVYAAPRLIVTLSEERAPSKRWMPWAEFFISLVTGPIGSAGFAQLVGITIHQTAVADLRAIALVIGMVANPVSPAIVHLVGENILHRLNAPLKPVKPRKPT